MRICTQYTYLHFARDLEAVRTALGYGRLNLFAGSYGTRAAQVYVRAYPDSVRTAYMGSVVPIDVVTPLTMAKASQAMFELDAGCLRRRSWLPRGLSKIAGGASTKHWSDSMPAWSRFGSRVRRPSHRSGAAVTSSGCEAGCTARRPPRRCHGSFTRPTPGTGHPSSKASRAGPGDRFGVWIRAFLLHHLRRGHRVHAGGRGGRIV